MVAFAGYPLKVDDRVIGVLGLFARHKLDRDALGALGDDLPTRSPSGSSASAPSSRREAAEHELRAQAERLELMNEIGKHLVRASTRSARSSSKITNVTTRLAGAQFGAFFYLRDGVTQAVYAGGDAFAKLAGHPDARGDARDHEPVRSDDIRREIRHAFELDVPIKSYLARAGHRARRHDRRRPACSATSARTCSALGPSA